MKNNRTLVGAFFCALLTLTTAENANAQEAEVKPHCIAATDPNGDPDQNTAAIQACNEQTYLTQEGELKKVPVLIPCGDYWVTKQLTFTNVPLLIAWGPSGCRVRLIAHPKLLNQRILFFYSVVGSEVAFIELDGNKEQRMRESMERNSPWPNACDPDDQRPANSEFHGINIRIHDFASRNAICGSAMGILGEFIMVWDAVIEDNGFAEGEWPLRSAQFSDGITSLFCMGCQFFRIKFRNNTDIDFVLGGGGWNFIHHNECTHDRTYGFACFNWGRFSAERLHSRTRLPWDGNHEGTVAEYNVVFAVENKLGHGFAIGKDMFEGNPSKWLADVGTIRYNRSFGAKHNGGVDGIDKGSIYGNLFQGARGTYTGAYNHCKTAYNFTAAHFGGAVRIEDRYDPVSLDAGVCKPASVIR